MYLIRGNINMTAMKKYPLIFLILFFAVSLLYSQEVELKSEHPIFKAYPGFTLYDYEKQDFGAYRFCDINGDNFIVEGQVTYYYYECDDTADPKNILTRFQEIGDSLDANMYGDGKNQLYMVVQSENRRMYVDLFAEDFYYTLNLVERGELKSEVSAEDLFNDLNEIGKAVLYFNFKRRDCELTSDCKDIIEMIAEALRKDPTMGISIDSYTDNIGPREENLQLSKNRAETIYNALVSEGIDKQRMVFNGYGESKPIADNSSVIGRAFNNRVEIVKK